SSPIPSTLHPRSIVSGFVNGDGNPDLVVANTGSNNLFIFFGDAAGHYPSVPNGAVATGAMPYALAMADLNGDGILDIAAANSDSNDVTVLLGDGKGGFTQASGSPFTAGTDPEAIAIGDLDGDGIPDIVVGNFSSNNITVLKGSGGGKFTPTNFAAGAGP